MIKQRTQEILTKEMDRKEFLRYTGVAFLALFGVSAVLKSLTTSTSLPGENTDTKAHGYGMSSYGR